MSTNRPIRIGNYAGFYGDRLSAAKEMVTQGPLDAITGDYLAELTMLILWKAQQKDASLGYAKTFLTQMEEILGTCLDRNIKIVANAGGLNPRGLTEELTELATRLGLAPKIAYITGDNILDDIPRLQSMGHEFKNLDTGEPLPSNGGQPVTANAYLGGWGITDALNQDADIVVCPRVTDASLVVGIAAWWHQWKRDDFDALAGAVVAGHVIECGPQASGGNYSFTDEIIDTRYPGYPIAEVASDGSTVITKHEETGGTITEGTVTAQLLYEIGPPAYLNPDVVAHFDTARVSEESPNRVKIAGVRGSTPPDSLKVAMNRLGGYRNSVTMVLTGLNIEEKAARAEELLFAELGGKEQFEQVDVQLARFDQTDADTEQLASAHLTIHVKDSDQTKVGRKFSNAATGLYLGGYAGFYTLTPPAAAIAYGSYWPTTVPVNEVCHQVVLPNGEIRDIQPTPGASEYGNTVNEEESTPEFPLTPTKSTLRLPLGVVCGARSGDKGGSVNVGLWTRTETSYQWLRDWMTAERFKEIAPETAHLPVMVYQLPNLRAVNIVIEGLLGNGVASSTRPDPQAKAFGEFIRSRHVDIPTVCLKSQ
jgi:hypothetical protein